MHIPVLREESVKALHLTEGTVVVDGTFGGGGHSTEILRVAPPHLRLICVDLDEAAKKRFEESALAKDTRACFVEANFKDAKTILEKGGAREVQGVLLDLGTSTFQLLSDTSGFSYQSDTPLRMSFSEKGSHTGFSAWDMVNTWEEGSLADIIFYYGEERAARKIARAIKEARTEKPIETGKQLSDIIEHLFSRRGKIHPATKTFQALRIAVNDELNVLKEALTNWNEVLAPGGRIAVITFHSLEDRIVKQWMKQSDTGKSLTKKPITPTRSEYTENKRARSAKLRIYEKYPS